MWYNLLPLNRIVFAVAGVIILGVLGLLVFMSKGVKAPYSSSSVSPSPTAAASAVSEFSDWTYFRNGYGVKIPPDWKNTSDTGGTAVLEPGRKVANFELVSVTILSDKKATGQRFTTQKEFDEWYALSGEVQGDIQKIDNTMVDGEKAIMLLDTTGGEDAWTVITWTRKDEVNLYLRVKGNKKYSKEDAAAIDYLVSSFRFEAPPPAPGEGK